MPLLLILIVLPLVEIGLFVVIGGQIGVWGVLALVVLSALTGIAILRGRLARIPELVRAGDDPARLMAGGAMTAMGAALLILPGFLTDLLGLLLLLPPLQRRVGDWIGRQRGVAPDRSAPGRVVIIEGEYVVDEPGPRETRRDSTDHAEPDEPRRLPRGH